MSGKTVTGDILDLAADGEFDVIVQGCNCYNTMGAGLAKQIKERFPAAWRADLTTRDIEPEDKLGGMTGANVSESGNEFTIINGYTQLDFRGYGSGKVLVDYDAVRQVFRNIAKNFAGKRIAYPAIGAGLARGDWDTIKGIINEELDGLDHTFVEYAG